jgi:hypothetical protein
VRVVLDANVVFSGVGWRGEAHNCLLAMAKRRITVFATQDILEEVWALAAARGNKFKHAPHTLLTWYYGQVSSAWRRVATTFQPRRAKCRAVALLKPDEVPVIKTVFFMPAFNLTPQALRDTP